MTKPSVARRRWKPSASPVLAAAGYGTMEFSSLGTAFRAGGNMTAGLTKVRRSYILAYGIKATTSPEAGDEGEEVWLPVTSLAAPDAYDEYAYRHARGEVDRLFIVEPTLYQLIGQKRGRG